MPSLTAMPMGCWSSIQHQVQKRVETKTFRPFSVFAGLRLARFVQFTGSQAVVGRLACLTVMPAFVIRNTTPSPE